MNSMHLRIALRIATLAAAVAAASTAAASDDWLLREMAKTDGDPNGDHGALHLDPRRAQRSLASDDSDLVREMARTDGDPLGLHASLPRALRAVGGQPHDKLGTAELLREMIRTMESGG